MLKKDVLAHYRNSASAVARELGITRSAVSQWGPVVPEGSAYKLEAVTGGRLRVNPSLYRKAA